MFFFFFFKVTCVRTHSIEILSFLSFRQSVCVLLAPSSRHWKLISSVTTDAGHRFSSVYFSESFLSLFLLVGGNVENWVRSKAQKPIERIEGRPSGV